MKLEGFSREIESFYGGHKALCICTLGLAVVGFALYTWCGRAVAWIRKSLGIAKKIEEIAREHFKNSPGIKGEGQIRPPSSPSVKPGSFQAVLDGAPNFQGYKIALDKNHSCHGVVLTGLSKRPANLFFDALFKGSKINTTQPGSNQLFAFTSPHAEVIKYLSTLPPDRVIEFSASKVEGWAKLNGGSKRIKINDLEEIYGEKTYAIAVQEILDTLKSQKIFLSPLLPIAFFRDLKVAMRADKIVTLPCDKSHPDNKPLLMREFPGENVKKILSKAATDPVAYDFSSKEQYDELLSMTIYQVGSMVVKTEDYRVFVDEDGKILERKAGQQDQIRLINACGIRGFCAEKTPKKFNRTIMANTFETALKSAESGYVVFPAVGMGIWRGDPNLYWRAFLDAVVQPCTDPIDRICVNPCHQKTLAGTYEGRIGDEFEEILNEYRASHKESHAALARLNKIEICADFSGSGNAKTGNGKDVVQLARKLKLAYPDKLVSLFNASDPDVTLGYHVGEYTNNVPHGFTTEENYTAMGTNGLCFEDITEVHGDEVRIIQA